MIILKFNSAQLKYNVTKNNITLPTIPGLLLELSCIVSGYLNYFILYL
jgi:hypothetical protein